MALLTHVGTFEIASGSTQEIITGLGFEPEVVIFFPSLLPKATGVQDHSTFSMGGSTGVGNDFTGVLWQSEASAPSDTSKSWSNTHSIKGSFKTQAGVEYEGLTGSFDPGGFTVDIDDISFGGKAVSFIALAGDDIEEIDIGLVNLSTTAAPTTQDVSIGFRPDSLILMSPQSTVTSDSHQVDAQMSIGFTDFTNQNYVSQTSEDNQGSLVCNRVSGNDGIVVSQDVNGFGLNGFASINSALSNGFRLDITTTFAGAYRCIYIAMKGPSVHVGTYDGLTAPGDIPVTGVGFTPKVVLGVGVHQLTFGGSLDSRFSIGAVGDVGGAESFAQSITGDAGTGNTKTRLNIDKFMLQVDNAGNQEGNQEMKSFDSDGFTVEQFEDTTLAGVYRNHYISWGDSIPAPITFIGSGEGQTDNVTTLDITHGLTILEGDLIVFMYSSDGDLSQLTPPTNDGVIESGDVFTTRCYALHYKVATASEPATYTWTNSVGERSVAFVSVYRGVDKTNPINSSNNNVVTTPSGTGVFTALTPTEDFCAVLTFIGTQEGNGSSTDSFDTWPTTITEREDISTPGTGTGASAGGFGDAIQIEAIEVSGTVDINHGDTQQYVTVVLALNVAVAPLGLQELGWNCRQTITVPASITSTDLTDKPVTIKTSAIPADVFDKSEADAKDLRVTTDILGKFLVPTQVIGADWDVTNGIVHFKAPTISSSVATIFYLWYDNPFAPVIAAPDPFGSENVWNDNYTTVLHLNEVLATMQDSTSNNNDGTPINAPVTINGILGKGILLDGVDQRIDLPDAIMNEAQGTVSIWGNLVDARNDASNNQNLFGTDNNAPGNRVFMGTSDSATSTANIRARLQASGEFGTGTVDEGEDHLFTLVWRADDSGEFYIDGVSVGTVAGEDFTSIEKPNIGSFNQGQNAFWDGEANECRISNISRTVEWILAGFRFIDDPATYLPFSDAICFDGGQGLINGGPINNNPLLGRRLVN